MITIPPMVEHTASITGQGEASTGRIPAGIDLELSIPPVSTRHNARGCMHVGYEIIRAVLIGAWLHCLYFGGCRGVCWHGSLMILTFEGYQH